MRSIIISVLLISLTSCLKETKDQSPYSGHWKITCTEGSDSSVAVLVNSNGEFEYRSRYLYFNGQIEGEINQNGKVDGSLKSGVVTVGSMSGKIEVDTGNGFYYITGNRISWAAKKID